MIGIPLSIEHTFIILIVVLVLAFTVVIIAKFLTKTLAEECADFRARKKNGKGD
jgi:uncharacterized membrane protein